MVIIELLVKMVAEGSGRGLLYVITNPSPPLYNPQVLPLKPNCFV
jgi:hypothetical protein